MTNVVTFFRKSLSSLGQSHMEPEYGDAPYYTEFRWPDA